MRGREKIHCYHVHFFFVIIRTKFTLIFQWIYVSKFSRICQFMSIYPFALQWISQIKANTHIGANSQRSHPLTESKIKCNLLYRFPFFFLPFFLLSNQIDSFHVFIFLSISSFLLFMLAAIYLQRTRNVTGLLVPFPSVFAARHV